MFAIGESGFRGGLRGTRGDNHHAYFRAIVPVEALRWAATLVLGMRSRFPEPAPRTREQGKGGFFDNWTEEGTWEAMKYVLYALMAIGVIIVVVVTLFKGGVIG